MHFRGLCAPVGRCSGSGGPLRAVSQQNRWTLGGAAGPGWSAGCGSSRLGASSLLPRSAVTVLCTGMTAWRAVGAPSCAQQVEQLGEVVLTTDAVLSRHCRVVHDADQPSTGCGLNSVLECPSPARDVHTPASGSQPQAPWSRRSCCGSPPIRPLTLILKVGSKSATNEPCELTLRIQFGSTCLS